MSLFFEASALTSIYVKDEMTPRVLSLFLEGHAVISALSLVEVRSGICKAGRLGKLSRDDQSILLQDFARDVRFLLKLQVSNTVLELASTLVESAVLKASDAIQLATFIVYQRQFDLDAKLVNADKQIHNAASTFNLPVIDIRLDAFCR